jgi:hypothetical protein
MISSASINTIHYLLCSAQQIPIPSAARKTNAVTHTLPHGLSSGSNLGGGTSAAEMGCASAARAGQVSEVDQSRGTRWEGGGGPFCARYVRRNIHAGVHHVTIWAGR